MIIFKKNYKTLIKEIFSPKWIYGTKILYLTIFLSFSLITYYHLFKGFVMSSDSFWYSEAADNLIKLDFNLFKYYLQNTHTIPSFFYTFPVLLIALSKLLFVTEWQNTFMIFNLIIVFFSLILFSKSLLLLKVRPLVISFAILFLTLSIDLLTWPRYVLTDMIFSFLVTFIIYVIIKSIVENKSYYFLLTLLMTLIFLTRPTSFAFIFAFIFFVFLLKIQINYSPKVIVLIIFSLFVFTPFILTIFYQLMKFYLNTNSKALLIIDMVQAGMIIHDRPETWIAKPENFFEIVSLYFTRLFYFFTPYIKNFSIIHILFNLLQAFIVLFSIFIWIFLGKKYDLINKTIMLILLTSIFVAGFHSFTLIDYDFRYRFPIIMPLMIIFPLSFEIYLRKILYNNTKY